MKDGNVIVRYCNIDQKRAKIIGFSLVCGERVLDAWMGIYLVNLATGDACADECAGTSRRALHLQGYASSTPMHTLIELAFASVHVRRHD